METSIKEKLILCAQNVEAALQGYLSRDHHHLEALARLEQAVKHASLAGGKRLRPFLVVETAHLFGVPAQEAMPAACAIEMVHSYSLVHDDLPAMDDADTRRGQPSVHKAFDEAIAILAGDALLTDAFALLTQGDYTGQVAMELVHTLATGAGSDGMVGGQMIDLYPVGMTEVEIIAIQRRKTGALIEAATEMGAILGRATEEEKTDLRHYAAALGLAFQIVDDVLDVTQTADVLGKPAGADEEAGKATFVSLLGLDGAQERILQLTENACQCLEGFGDKGTTLKALAQDLAARTR